MVMLVMLVMLLLLHVVRRSLGERIRFQVAILKHAGMSLHPHPHLPYHLRHFHLFLHLHFQFHTLTTPRLLLLLPQLRLQTLTQKPVGSRCCCQVQLGH
jgi:hypothetical protein